jgi:hypothetical protein
MARRLLVSSLALTLGLLGCGSSDDLAEGADEAGPAGEANSADNNGEANSAEGSGSTNDATASDGSTDADSTAGSTDADSTAGSTDADSTASSTDADSTATENDDTPPMDGPDTHSSIDTGEGVVETDTGLMGECFTACDCQQGLDCTDTLVCAPVPDNAYCCTNPGCPVGEPCENPDGTFDVCS